MKQHRGYTLLELMIVVGIIISIISIFSILLGVAMQFRKDPTSNGDGTICKGGYKFTGRDSRAAQIIDSQGHGIPCTGAQ